MLVRPHDRGIDLGSPVQIARSVRVGLQPLLDPCPRPVGLPPSEPVVAGLPRPIPLWDLTPLRAVVYPPENPVDHLPVIPPPTAALRSHARQQRHQPSPLRIR